VDVWPLPEVNLTLTASYASWPPSGRGMPYSHVNAVVRIALSAARNPVVTSWLVLTRKALPLVPATARASRFAWAPTCSAGVKTPMTNVAIDGVPRAAVVARAAMDGMAVGVHSVGNPSVANTTMTRWTGLAVASALACARAPERAGASRRESIDDVRRQ